MTFVDTEPERALQLIDSARLAGNLSDVRADIQRARVYGRSHAEIRTDSANELKEKNDVIVREVRRNQTLIDRAVQQGVSRAAMLSFFGKFVKEHLGMSPTQYRQQNLKIGNRNLKPET